MYSHNFRNRGVTLVELIVTVAVIGILIAVSLPAVQRARESGRLVQCRNNLRQIGVALSSYQAAHQVYPFGVGADDDKPGSPTYTSSSSRRYSIHSQLLPFLELSPVYERIDFRIQPFFPDTTGDPAVVTGNGPNERAAVTHIPAFICPSDVNRLHRPWGTNNYRSCNGSSWQGRTADGMFGQAVAFRPADVLDGLSNTAAFSERIRGDDEHELIDLDSDLFGLAQNWTEPTLRQWCDQLTASEAATLAIQDSNSGMTWLEGNMLWTRYNHVLPPGRPSCKGQYTWDGVAMTANSRHNGGVNLLLADGAVQFVSVAVDRNVWSALGTRRGGEAIRADW
ncbi:MAG TPA: DUF1559 domain-containing protein [Pirellulales bacterium]|nr:DUF1559 domain-containing protein [Pirellulales bacterium]